MPSWTNGQQWILVIGSRARRKTLTLALERTRFQIIGLAEAAEAPKGVLDDALQLVMVSEDILVADMGLLTVLRRLTDVPIMVVGSGNRETLARMLLEGADCYLSWETSPRIFLAHVRALSRRSTTGYRRYPASPWEGEGDERENGSGRCRTEQVATTRGRATD